MMLTEARRHVVAFLRTSFGLIATSSRLGHHVSSAALAKPRPSWVT